MRIAFTGATGFLGTRIVQELSEAGHQLQILGRKGGPSLPASARFWTWDSTQGEPPAASLEDIDAVINLAGEPVAKRWNIEVKQRIRASRVDGTRNLVAALSKLPQKPEVLVNASAIGIYGSRGDEILTEQSRPGDGFLADVTKEWEDAAGHAEAFGVRVVKVRIGIVLGTGGGALAQMLPPFRAGVGGKLGSGRQWMSWIHVDDVVNLILFALNHSAVRGPVNATAPNPVRNTEFTRQLGAALHRPAILPAPAFALKMIFGEMGDVILGSQRVSPQAAEAAGYRFRYRDLPDALRNLL